MGHPEGRTAGVRWDGGGDDEDDGGGGDDGDNEGNEAEEEERKRKLLVLLIGFASSEKSGSNVLKRVSLSVLATANLANTSRRTDWSTAPPGRPAQRTTPCWLPAQHLALASLAWRKDCSSLVALKK